MTDKAPRSDPAAELRKQAEGIAREKAAQSPEHLEALSSEEIQQTFHELQVYQIELELQNEELRRAQVELYAARARYFDLYDLAPVGYCTLSEPGLILEANLTAAGLLGVARGEMVKQPITRFILKEDQDLYYLHRKQLFETDEPQASELRMLRQDGVQFWAHLEATVAKDDDGVPVCRLVISDITDRKRTEAVVKTQNERLHLLWEAARVLLSSDDADAILHGLLAKIGPPLGVDTYFNYMVDDTGDALRLASCAGIHEETARSIERLEFGKHISGTVALRRQSIVVTHIQQSDDPKAQLVKSLGLRACVCNPLMSGDLLLGTFSFASRTRDQFDPDDLAVLQTISYYVSVAYERLRLLNTLRESDRYKDEFLAMLSHELRSPLAPILNAVQLLGLQPDESVPQRQARTIIERQLGQLVHLVNDLLEVSRISTGKLQLQREQLDMRSVVKDSVETVRHLIEQRHHALDVHLPASPIWIDGDLTRLEQVVVNLLSNAAKYMDEGGHIWLSLQQEGNTAVLQVRDSGIGIAPELLPRIFDLFTQAKQSLARSQGGLGIGLSLVQRLMEMHGGKVTAHSVVGQGSEFVVRLPVMLTAEPQPRPSSPPTETAKPAGPSLRVLVVEDKGDTAASLAMLLGESGHDVRTAPDGPTALEAALDYRPDVALLDLGLPGLDGFEVARRMRQQPILQKVVLVALTGYGNKSDRQRLQEAGFDHCLIKTAKFEKLQRILASVSEPTLGTQSRPRQL